MWGRVLFKQGRTHKAKPVNRAAVSQGPAGFHGRVMPRARPPRPTQIGCFLFLYMRRWSPVIISAALPRPRVRFITRILLGAELPQLGPRRSPQEPRASRTQVGEGFEKLLHVTDSVEHRSTASTVRHRFRHRFRLQVLRRQTLQLHLPGSLSGPPALSPSTVTTPRVRPCTFTGQLRVFQARRQTLKTPFMAMV